MAGSLQVHEGHRALAELEAGQILVGRPCEHVDQGIPQANDVEGVPLATWGVGTRLVLIIFSEHEAPRYLRRRSFVPGEGPAVSF